MFHVSCPESLILVTSPNDCGANNSSPGPVKVVSDISPLAINFFMLNLTEPFTVIVGDMAIMAPGLTFKGQFIASWRVTIVLVSRCEIR